MVESLSADAGDMGSVLVLPGIPHAVWQLSP